MISMLFDPCCAESMGSLIHEGRHRPFRALACPLKLKTVRITAKGSNRLYQIESDSEH